MSEFLSFLAGAILAGSGYRLLMSYVNASHERMQERVEALSKLNPDNITLEDVCNIMDVDISHASRLCQALVRNGTFTWKVTHPYGLAKEVVVYSYVNK